MTFPSYSPGLLGCGVGELQGPAASTFVFIFKEPQVNEGENGALFSESPKDRTHRQPA